MTPFFHLIRRVATFLILTILTQLGGFVYLASSILARVWGLKTWQRIALHLLVYFFGALFVIPLVARLGGRAALPLWASDQRPVAPRSILYVLANRHYVKPAVRDVVITAAIELNKVYPDSVVYYLDGGFPLFDKFLMLPHISHGSGNAIDLTFCYRSSKTDEYSRSPSPIGYWIYEEPESGEPQPYRDRRSWLRWNFSWLQGVNRDRKVDRERTRFLVRELLGDQRTAKVLLEVHLHRRWGIVHSKLRFQQLHAARHDDHLHLSVKPQ